LTKEKRSSPYNMDFGTAVMLSSPDQIMYARRAFGADTTAFVKSLVKRLEEHPGELVSLRDPALPPEPPQPDSIIDGPWKVAVLTNRSTVSASEVLVLKALQSKRATVIGEPTEGALDYQSTRIVWFSPNERRWGVGYPTITDHATLPIGGIRGKGIQPDIRLDWKTVRDPVATVQRLLDQRK
jgi:C-terminal processing protease CtpA/Prc